MVRGVHAHGKFCLIRKRRTKAEMVQAKARRQENEELINVLTIENNEQNADESANEHDFVEINGQDFNQEFQGTEQNENRLTN